VADDLPTDARQRAEGLARIFADEPDPITRYALVRNAVRDFQEDLKIKRRRGESVGGFDLIARFEHHLWRTLQDHLDARGRDSGTT
jgi:hypothetical protein